MKENEQFDYRQLSELIKTMLLGDRPFYGYVLKNFSRKISDEISTAAISQDTMTLYVNAEFMGGLENDVARIQVLEHEVLHVVCNHFIRFEYAWSGKNDPNDKYGLNKNSTRMAANIACDCAINQLILNFILKEGITLENFRKHVCAAAEAMQTAEYYIALYKNKNEKNDKKNNKSLSDAIDKALKNADESHSFSAKNSNKSSESKAKIKDIIKTAKAYQKDRDAKRGVAPGNSILDVLPKDADTNVDVWKKLVDKLIGDEITVDVETRFGRQSRRHEDSMFYKKRLTAGKKVYIGIDSSGSISDNDLSKFLGHVNKKLRSNSCTATVFVADTKITNTYENVKYIPKSGIKIGGRGGTDMTVILDEIEKREKNATNTRLILLTDGETPWRKSNVKTSVIYTSKNGGNMSDIYNSANIIS
jgi:predicted metal-dependent peptidase